MQTKKGKKKKKFVFFGFRKFNLIQFGPFLQQKKLKLIDVNFNFFSISILGSSYSYKLNIFTRN